MKSKINGIFFIVVFALMTSYLYCGTDIDVGLFNATDVWLNVWLDGGSCCEGATYKLDPGASESKRISGSKSLKCLFKIGDECCPKKAYVHWDWDAKAKKWGNRVIVDVPSAPEVGCDVATLTVSFDDKGKPQVSWEA